MIAEISHADLFPWLASWEEKAPAVATVLPDAEEVGLDPDAWADWFMGAAAACFAAAPAGPIAFVQTDRMRDGGWIDKPGLIERAAAGRQLVWHKVALRRPVGAVDLHRPTYSHVLAYGPARPGRRTPDVIESGAYLWRNGIGVDVARLLVGWMAGQGVRSLLNPCCGHGTILAAADELGIYGYGCDTDPDRVLAAQRATLRPPQGALL